MGRLPGSWDPPAWGGPWGGLLLAASVLSSSFQPAPAQTVLITPQSPAVGGGVSLAPQPPPENVLLCKWFRSAIPDENRRIFNYIPNPPTQSNGPAHTGRETAGPNCALNIAGLTLSDIGNYTLKVDLINGSSLTPITVGLRIYASPTADLGPSLSAGAIAGIVIGSLAGAGLVGSLVYFLSSGRQSKTPRDSETTPPVYENLPPAAQAGPAAQPGSSPDTGPTYETLQPGQRDVYDQLRR